MFKFYCMVILIIFNFCLGNILWASKPMFPKYMAADFRDYPFKCDLRVKRYNDTTWHYDTIYLKMQNKHSHLMYLVVELDPSYHNNTFRDKRTIWLTQQGSSWVNTPNYKFTFPFNQLQGSELEIEKQELVKIDPHWCEVLTEKEWERATGIRD